MNKQAGSLHKQVIYQ